MSDTNHNPIYLTLRSMEQQSGYSLALSADCAAPDSPESAGATFLTGIRDGVVEGIETALHGLADLDDIDTIAALNIDSIVQLVEGWFEEGGHEIADGAPSIYNHERWLEFVDLAAWQEEPEITGAWSQDLTETAGWALYQIAERLVHSLQEEFLAEVREAVEDMQAAEEAG